MAGCLLAQHLARRVDTLEAENSELRELLLLLAAAAGVDVTRLLLAAHVERRAGYVSTWEDMVALGLDPDDGDAA